MRGGGRAKRDRLSEVAAIQSFRSTTDDADRGRRGKRQTRRLAPQEHSVSGHGLKPVRCHKRGLSAYGYRLTYAADCEYSGDGCAIARLQGEAADKNHESGRRDLGFVESGWKAGKAETAIGIGERTAIPLSEMQAERNGGPWNIGPADIGNGSRDLGEPIEWAAIMFHLEVKRAMLTGPDSLLADNASGAIFEVNSEVVRAVELSIWACAAHQIETVIVTIPVHRFEAQRGVPGIAQHRILP